MKLPSLVDLLLFFYYCQRLKRKRTASRELVFAFLGVKRKLVPAKIIFFSLDFHFNVEIHFCFIILDCSHLGKKYLLKGHTKNPNISFLISCLKVPKFSEIFQKPSEIFQFNALRARKQVPQKLVHAKISSLKVAS